MKKEENYNIFDWWKKVVLENYTNFNGRARRKEYWSFHLVNFIFIIPLYLLILFTAVTENRSLMFVPLIIIVILGLGLILPSLAVLVRRLHDTNRSGWSFLLGLIPLVGGLIMLYFYFSDGTIGRNNYGDDPKRPHNEISEIGVSQE